MKALIVAGAPGREVSETVSRIAAAHDYVIAADAGAASCLAAHVEPDMVVGDLDSLDEGLRTTLEAHQVPMRVVSAEKDETDLDLAIQAAREAGASTATFTGVIGGRLDHTLAAIGSLARASDLMPELVESGLVGWLLAEDGMRRLEIRRHLGATVSLLALVDSTVSCEGFRYPLDRERLSPLSSRGVSNVCTGLASVVEVHSGTLLVLLLPEHD